MLLYNTADPSYQLPLKDCVLQSLAPAKGLYMPVSIPKLDNDFFKNIEKYSFQELSFLIAKNLIGNYIEELELREIIQRAIDFPAPLVKVSEHIYSLELWHGPSLAFKDFGARFMAELMFSFTKESKQKLTILVATSGDTGGAVAYGFLNVPNIEVIILYPKGKVSDLQEKQLTTLGGNIFACEVDGTFDDCQAMVKEAFSDETLDKKYKLSSANSINIARLIPQSFYFFEAFKQLQDKSTPIVVSVPSGNFGNLTAGLMAWKMGLPIHKFIAATNINNIVPEYILTAQYLPKPSISTISNAMDVGSPSNFVRMKELFGGNHNDFTNQISGAFYTDEETREEMKLVYKNDNYICDPHGAIGHRALREYLLRHSGLQGFFLETAHSAKFENTVNETLNIKVGIPERLAAVANRTKVSTLLKPIYLDFREYLMSR